MIIPKIWRPVSFSPMKIAAKLAVNKGPNTKKGLMIEIAVCLSAFAIKRYAIDARNETP